MKKIFLFLILAVIFFSVNAFADRDTATVATYNSDTLVQRGDAKIYSISFVATANNGYFIVKNSVELTQGYSDVKAEGREATSGNSQFQDFANKPLEMSTGLYLMVSNGYVVIRYE